MEEVTLELIEKYPEVDKDLMRVLVWVHDYSKPFKPDKREEKESLFSMVREVLRELEFEMSFVERVVSVLAEVESKDTTRIEDTSIEAQILSSADGASHFIGPFFFSYFRNDSHEHINDTMKRVREKAVRDWEKKVVLPGARELIRVRYEILMENMELRG